MESKKVYDFIHNCIITASQSAYVSHDHNTYNFLKMTDEVFLYLSRSHKTTSLFSELEILRKYALIQKTKYGERINLIVKNIEEYKDLTIAHLMVIDFYSEILKAALDLYEGDLLFDLNFDLNDGIRVIMTLRNGINTSAYECLI